MPDCPSTSHGKLVQWVSFNMVGYKVTGSNPGRLTLHLKYFIVPEQGGRHLLNHALKA